MISELQPWCRTFRSSRKDKRPRLLENGWFLLVWLLEFGLPNFGEWLFYSMVVKDERHQKAMKGSYWLGQKGEAKTLFFYLRQLKNPLKTIQCKILFYYTNNKKLIDNFINGLRSDQQLVIMLRPLWQLYKRLVTTTYPTILNFSSNIFDNLSTYRQPLWQP